jgi:hypothetical protein
MPEQVAGAVAVISCSCSALGIPLAPTQQAPQAQQEFLRRPQGAAERLSTATNAATSAAERMVVPPPEAIAAQQSTYQRYLDARRGFATQPSSGVPGAAAPFNPDFSKFENAVHEFGSWVASLGQKNPDVAARINAATAPPQLPDYFPQGKGSGLVTAPTAAPPLVPAGGAQTAAVYRDKSGNPVVVQPGQPLPGFADGGDVPGSGTGDTVPAMLTPGEYVVDRLTMQNPGAREAIRQLEGGGRLDLAGLTGTKGTDLSGLSQRGQIDFGISSPRMSIPNVNLERSSGSSEPSGVFHFHAADGRVGVGRVTGRQIVELLSREAISQKEDRAFISPSWNGA